MPAPDWAQKIPCIIVPNRRTVSPEFFSWVVHDSYCLDHGCTKEMYAVIKISVWYKIPIWFKILSARKLNTLSKNTSLSLQQVFMLESVTSCVNIREVLKDTTTAASHENVAWKSDSHFFSLYRDYSNSLTFPHASELFWNWISISHIQVHEESEICHCLFTCFTKREIRHFHG